jgi:hypothetical protein
MPTGSRSITAAGGVQPASRVAASSSAVMKSSALVKNTLTPAKQRNGRKRFAFAPRAPTNQLGKIMLHTHKPMTDEAIKAMQARTAARVAICQRVLGVKYICHPSQQIERRIDIKMGSAIGKTDQFMRDMRYPLTNESIQAKSTMMFMTPPNVGKTRAFSYDALKAFFDGDIESFKRLIF